MMSSGLSVREDVLPGQILQAALQLYQKHGLKKVTMDDVSKAIGKSRTTLYYYYKNRDEIFGAVMEQLIHEVMDEMEKAVAEADSPKNKIRAFCLTKIKVSEEKKAFFNAMEAGMDEDEISAHAAVMSSFHQRLMQEEAILLKKMLTAGMKQGKIRPMRPKERRMLIFVLLSGIRGMKRELQRKNDFGDLHAAVNTFTDMAVKWLQ